ncbi:MAG: DUF1800 family protein [Burkholderiales bacterium]
MPAVDQEEPGERRSMRELGPFDTIVAAVGRRAALLALFAAALAPAVARAGLGTAVEFYNVKLNHYFLTANPAEAAALDAGTNVKGWTRTGGQFTVFTDPAAGLSAVCRFFGTPGVGPNSHFYTADAAECAKVKTLPAWTFEEVAFYIPTTSDGNCGGNWPVYRSYYSDQISDANHRFTVDLTAHVRMAQRRGDTLEGIVMCAPVTEEEREADVVRFLEQATLGPTEALVAEVKAKGIAAWIDEQIPMNVTRYTQYPYFERPVDPLTCIDDQTPPITPEKFCNTNQSERPIAWEFFRQSRTAPDQLRMRMAHLWHEILIANDGARYGQAEFQQRLRDRAFGTYEELLLNYTISPQLGHYQNWVCNLPEHDGIRPNENYAREVMQLMTIGVSELNEDGTLRFGSDKQTIATYGQSDISALARVLTGYSMPLMPGHSRGQFCGEPEYYLGDMVGLDQFHDRGPKTALAGRLQMPAGGGAQAEVRGLIHALIEHPNAPPFIAKQMIQKTVTSSPTPGYVSRIVSVFKNNGKGVRGDLAAITRAILLDPEARGARKIDPEYGRLREPVLFWTGMIRALDVTTDGLQPKNLANESGQNLFGPFTIFSYYPADYTLAGGSIPGPEFGIFGSSEFINRANQITGLLYNSNFPEALQFWGPQPFVANATGTPSPALTAFLADAANPEVLVARLDRLFLHGTMPADARSTIVNAVNKIPTAETLARARLAINLVLVSIDYQVQK